MYQYASQQSNINMKKLLFIGLGAAAIMSACNSRPANQYNVNGTISGADGQTIYMSVSMGDSMRIDSAVVENGKFAFSGTTDNVVGAVIYKGKPVWGSQTVTQAYLEPGAVITVDGLTGEDFTGAVIEGSKTQKDADAYQAGYKPLLDRLLALRAESETADASAVDSLTVLMDSLSHEMKAYEVEYIKNNPSKVYAAMQLNTMSSGLSLDQLKELYEGLAPEVRSYAGEIAGEIAAQEAVQPGKPAPDLIGMNPEGQEIKLSDLKGKTVLIDFWATWCVPCRKGLPHVKACYDKYHDQGLEVFCVADNDNEPDKWKEVIVEEGMEYYHNILRGMKTLKDANGQFAGFDRSNDQSEKYAVHFLPTKYLIGADGNIIARIESDEDLDARLKEIYGK